MIYGNYLNESIDKDTLEKDIELLDSNPDDLSEFSDGNHTFEELYNHRSILFAALVNCNVENSWKSRYYDNGNKIEGDYFMTGIGTGAIRYHIKNKFWDLFKCKELDKCIPWDGSTPNDCLKELESTFCK